MKIKDYQKWVHQDHGKRAASLDILGLRFAGEAGELAQAIGKRETLDEVLLEMGDVLYYLVRLSQFHGVTLEEIAGLNVEKLEKRRKG